MNFFKTMTNLSLKSASSPPEKQNNGGVTAVPIVRVQVPNNESTV